MTSSDFSSQIIHLELDDFDKTDRTFLHDHLGKPVLIFIYANWCGHCTSVKPTIIELNKELMKTGEGLIVAVNSDDRDVASLLEVNSFPSFFKVEASSQKLIDISEAVGDRSFNSIKSALLGD